MSFHDFYSIFRNISINFRGWNNWDQQQKDDFEICEENSTFAHLAYVYPNNKCCLKLAM